jgi:hypothetical protein
LGQKIAAYESIKAFSDFTEDLKRFDVPTLDTCGEATRSFL